MKITAGVIKRLQEINNDSGLSTRQFSLMIANSPSALFQIYNNNVKVLSKPIISLLEMKYGINPEWLKTGKGAKTTAGQFVNDEDELAILQGFRKLSLEKKRMSLIFFRALVNDEVREKKRKKKDSKIRDLPVHAAYANK